MNSVFLVNSLGLFTALGRVKSILGTSELSLAQRETSAFLRNKYRLMDMISERPNAKPDKHLQTRSIINYCCQYENKLPCIRSGQSKFIISKDLILQTFFHLSCNY